MPVKHNLPLRDYLSIDAVSASRLKLLRKSPAHYLAAMEMPSIQTPALRFGSLAHSLILEPAQTKLAITPQCDRRTKVGKATHAEFLEEHKGHEIVSLEDFEALMGMQKAVFAHPSAAALLEDDVATELSIFWEESIESVDEGITYKADVPCKARLDRLTSYDILDLKTAEDASPEGFRRAIKRYGYDLQAAWYIRAAKAVGLNANRFIFIAVEKTPPYAVGCYVIAPLDIEDAHQHTQYLLESLVACELAGSYPAYSDDILTVNLTLQEEVS